MFLLSRNKVALIIVIGYHVISSLTILFLMIFGVNDAEKDKQIAGLIFYIVMLILCIRSLLIIYKPVEFSFDENNSNDNLD